MNLSRVDNIYLPVNKFYLQEVTNYIIKKLKKKKKLVLKMKLHHVQLHFKKYLLNTFYSCHCQWLL